METQVVTKTSKRTTEVLMEAANKGTQLVAVGKATLESAKALEVTLMANKALAVVEDISDWGVKEVSANDLIVPQILVMQGLSVLVVDEKAAIGEFRDSLTGSLLGHYTTAPIEVIPFYCTEVFSISKQLPDGGFKYLRTDAIIKSPMKAGYNDNAPWSDKEMINGALTEIKRTRRYNFFVLLPSEIEAMGEAAMPYFISFKSTSVKEGKKLFNMMYVRNIASGLAPAAFHFKIAGKKEKNEKGTFIVPTVEQSAKTSSIELSMALKWYKMVSGGAAAVKMHDDDAETTVADTGTGEF